MAELIFRTEKVNNRVTRIFAFATELMYLVEGNEKAALLDTGSGIGFVRPLIESLTDKPLIVLLTHGHVDHAMGASEFPEQSVYINQEDAQIYEQHCTWAFRKDGLFLMGEAGKTITEDDFTPVVSIYAYHDLKEGDCFDLGGIAIETYACPGHTKGSVVFLIREERLLLLGDACNSFTFLFEDYSLSIEEYMNNLISLKQKTAGKFDRVLASHDDGNLYEGIMDENLELCERILKGTSDAIPMEFRGSKGMIANGKAEKAHGNIVYNPKNIRRSE